MQQYDYIIAGAGAAGLSLVTRLMASGKFDDKKILLIDRGPKTVNDRTWCFWEKENSFFEEIIHRKWNRLYFHSNHFSADLDMQPYQYKMIRGIDFYNWCFAKINAKKNIDIRYGEVFIDKEQTASTKIYLDKEEIITGNALVFNSIHSARISKKNNLDLLQHFKGWIIETKDPVFDSGSATLMDFRVSQDNGTTFVYVMPLSTHQALVEYTLFTEAILPLEQYESALRKYISQYLKINEYRIVEEEFGIIPMTNAQFPFYQNGIYNIGTAGGQTKASTGYTFQFIQKQTSRIVDFLSAGQSLHQLKPAPARFNFYDSVLLQLLSKRTIEGSDIFSRLFKRNKASAIFKFLDNETSLPEELRLISTLQISPFFKAALKQLV
jgi:lycopene beta-cyclase